MINYSIKASEEEIWRTPPFVKTRSPNLKYLSSKAYIWTLQRVYLVKFYNSLLTIHKHLDYTY